MSELFTGAADMKAGGPQERAAARLRENEAAISVEAEYIENRDILGSHLSTNRLWPDADALQRR